MSEQSTRNTQFAGFAKALADELRVTGGYPISEVRQIIARRAYDFANHVIGSLNSYIYDVEVDQSKIINNVDDMTTLP